MGEPLEMRPIPPGGGVLGGDESRDGRVEVIFPRGFLLSATPVTQSLYEAVSGVNPSKSRGPNLPVEKVSWYDAVRFCNRLSRLWGLEEAYDLDGVTVRWRRDSTGYRLPTEAEWEYACIAGNGPELSPEEVRDVAWCRENSGGGLHPVGLKRPNPWMLYDMLGGVWEWCWDRYGQRCPDNGPLVDPTGPPHGDSRVLRGGSWRNRARDIGATVRNGWWPGQVADNVGLRVARSFPPDTHHPRVLEGTISE